MHAQPDRRSPATAPLAIATCLLLAGPLAASAEDCNELIRLGLYNISSSVNVYDAQVAAYNHLCSESYSSSSSDKKKSQGISFSFMDVSLGWNGSKGTALTQTSWSKVCQDSALRNQLYTYSSTTSQQISDNALIAWQSCLAMKARGLRTDIRPTSNLTGVSFDLFWLGSSPAWFRGLDQPDIGQATCTVSIPGTTSATGTQVAKPTTAFRLGTAAATFVCQRQMITLANNTKYSDALRLTVKTSDGSFDVDLPPIGLRQVSIAEINGLHGRVAGLETVNRSAKPISCSPPSWENKLAWVPLVPNYADIYSCNVTVPSKGLLSLNLDAFIQGTTCHFYMNVDGANAGSAAFTKNTSTTGESGHGAATVSVGPGKHVIRVRASRWYGTDPCYLGGGGITGLFLPQL